MDNKSWHTAATTYLHLAGEEGEQEKGTWWSLALRMGTVFATMLVALGCQGDDGSSGSALAFKADVGDDADTTGTATGTGPNTATATGTGGGNDGTGTGTAHGPASTLRPPRGPERGARDRHRHGHRHRNATATDTDTATDPNTVDGTGTNTATGTGPDTQPPRAPGPGSRHRHRYGDW
jgi:hypothetical protein